MSDFNTVLVGHSFIRRFRDYHLPYHAGGQDILQPNAVRAAQLSDALNLEHHVEGVYTYAGNVVMADDLTHSIPLIRAVRPNIVLMDIGSNDLANLHMTDHFSSLDLATRVFDKAKQYNEQCSVPMVIINSILPRSNNIACMANVFLGNAEHYNNVVSNYCDKKNIIYNKQGDFILWRSRVSRFLALCPPGLRMASIVTYLIVWLNTPRDCNVPFWTTVVTCICNSYVSGFWHHYPIAHEHWNPIFIWTCHMTIIQCGTPQTSSLPYQS